MTITIGGDRQTGKTEMLLNVAATALSDGQMALYLTDTHAATSEAFRRLVQTIPAHAVKRVCRANGQEHVAGQNGGIVHFVSVSRSGGRGFCPDVVLLDGISADYEHYFPMSKVYRTSL